MLEGKNMSKYFVADFSWSNLRKYCDNMLIFQQLINKI